MTFLNASLLAGTALIAVPIILHLIMRRKPTLFEFPALRFVQQKHDTNQRKLNLRHILLLLLRAGIIAFLAFALARPSVQFGGALGSQEAPVAAALIFDAAPRMEYLRENQTRLKTAKEMGLWLLAQLPQESEIAVLDTRQGTATFQADRSAARHSIERLETVPNSQPLIYAVDESLRLLKESSLARKEIYVFTDFSRAAWPAALTSQLQDSLEKLPGVGIYVIDVGVADPMDYALGEPRLSAEVLSNRSPLTIQTELACLGSKKGSELFSPKVNANPDSSQENSSDPFLQRTVELYVIDADGKPQKRSVESVTVAPGEAQQIEFSLASLGLGAHQGYLQIVGQDALAADDKRFFSVEVKPPWRILIAAPKPADSYSIFLTEALAPSVFGKRGQARFDCDIVDLENISKKNLSDYAALFLLDPTPLEPAVWQKLSDYAADGHGVAIFLGRNAQPMDSFNTTQAQELLPGNLLRQARRPEGDLHLAPRDLQHPILAPFRSQSGSVPWNRSPIFRYWELDKPHSGVGVVLSFSDGRPAVLERPVGSGRALTITTPVSDRPNQNPWNLLPVSDEAWPFLILVNQMASYLVGSGNEQLNYFAGQTAVLQLDPETQRANYLLTGPGDMSVPLSADPQHHRLVITATEQPGNYRVQSGGREAGFDRPLSVNLAPEQTQLQRLDKKELTQIFAPDKIRIAQTKQQIDRDISMGRVGRELFPPLILAVALFLALESLLANRFYRSPER
ncbi:MAG: BatA domain-containing protein [Thermoguttaceae bacterium]